MMCDAIYKSIRCQKLGAKQATSQGTRTFHFSQHERGVPKVPPQIMITPGRGTGTDSFSPTPFPFPPLKTGMGLIGGWRYERERTLTPFSDPSSPLFQISRKKIGRFRAIGE
jgi:hypothetical protein